MTITPITAADAGCWFEGAASRTADELNVAVIHAALDRGWEPEDASDLAALTVDGWFAEPTEETGYVSDGEYASDAAIRACDYLTGIAPSGYYFHFEDGFYLTAICDAEFFDPRDEACPHGADCPNAIWECDECGEHNPRLTSYMGDNMARVPQQCRTCNSDRLTILTPDV